MHLWCWCHRIDFSYQILLGKASPWCEHLAAHSNLCGGNCMRPSLHCPTDDPFCNQAEIMLLKSGRYYFFHAGLFLGPCCTDIANSNKLLWVMCSALVMWASYLLERELRHQQRAKEWIKEKSPIKWNKAASSGRLLAKLLRSSGSHLVYLMGGITCRVLEVNPLKWRNVPKDCG